VNTAPAKVGARGCDSLAFSEGGGAGEAAALKAAGIDYFVGYLGSVTPARLAAILGAGLAFMAVTFADRFDGPSTVAQCKALGLPAGCTVWLDLESAPAVTADTINTWAAAVRGAGYDPGLYVGCNQPFDPAALHALGVDRYWRAPGAIPDPAGSGFCMYQLWPSVTWAGVLVDVDFVQQDWQGRVPYWVTA
jgi:hypothetical protein